MALPQLNTARYETTVPSTGQTITYRPYLVKEEKILMLAMESEDQKQIVNATKSMITSCVFDELDVNKLAMFDIESIFLALRSKSVGETVGLKVKCTSCEKQNDVTVDFNDVKVDVDSAQRDVRITDTVGITMRYPSFDDISGIKEGEEESIDTAFSLITNCIESIYDENGVYTPQTEGPTAIKNFVESLNSTQFQELSVFFQNMPTLTHKIEFNCTGCTAHNATELKGLQSFFI